MKRTLTIALALSAALLSAAHAAPITGPLTGQITDWPAGKKGEVQLRVAAFASGQKNVVVASAPIDEKGKFSLKLPSGAALTKVLAARGPSFTYAGDCTGKLTLAPAAQFGLFELMGYVDGEVRNYTVKFRTTRHPLPGTGALIQALAYSSAPTKVSGQGTCDFSQNEYYNTSTGETLQVWNADLKTGWNTVTIGMNGTEKMLFGNEAMPKTAFWHVYEGYGGVGLTPVATADGKGIEIGQLAAGGAAEKAGLKVGDRIVQVNSYEVKDSDVNALGGIVRGEADTVVTFFVKRGDQTLTIPVKRAFIRTN